LSPNLNKPATCVCQGDQRITQRLSRPYFSCPALYFRTGLSSAPAVGHLSLAES